MGKVNVKYMTDASLRSLILMINVNLLILHVQLMKRVVLIYKIAHYMLNKVIVKSIQKEINVIMMNKKRNVSN